MQKPDPADGTIVYGRSDDCVEFEGRIYEEEYADGQEIAFNDGTVLRLDYKNTGTWGITVLTTGSSLIRVKQCVAEDSATECYSDVAIFDDTVTEYVLR